jgi:phosphate transport system ATP-binding protein
MLGGEATGGVRMIDAGTKPTDGQGKPRVAAPVVVGAGGGVGGGGGGRAGGPGVGGGLAVIEAIKRGENVQGATHEAVLQTEHLLHIRNFQLWYGKSKALHGITMPVTGRRVTALIGPSGCGKSTLLRSVNRLNDLIDGVRVEGSMSVGGLDIYDRATDVIALRRKVGMVFQKPNPFPMSIFENIAYPLRIYGEGRRSVLSEVCEKSLRAAALWDEVKDRLKESALGLSGGQQQRLCIARAIAAEPEVLLMDEPCSALDPVATLRIEELITQISQKYTVLIVTHNMQQASRVSDYTAFMYLGRLVEYGPTDAIFQRPMLPETEQYVTGRFG